MTTLAEEIAKPAYDGKSDQQIADALNAKTQPAPIPAVAVQRYLILQGKWAPIVRSTDLAAVNMVQTLAIFDTIDAQTYADAIGAALQAVVDAGLMSADDKAAILALGDNQRSIAQVNGWRLPNVGDVMAARAG